MLADKVIKRLESEAAKYAFDAVKNPGPVNGVVFKAGVAHGYLQALSHAEQWIREELEEDGDDKDE